MNELPIKIKACELTRNSATFQPALPWNEWMEAGHQLCKVAGATLWWLGDWINYGEKAYGEKYKLALETMDYDYQTLRNAAWVSNKIVPSTRQLGLSWSHHSEVAQFNGDNQMQWLQKAAVNQWSVSQLRQAIRKHNAVFASDDDEPNPGLFKWLNAAFEVDRHLKSEDPSKWPKERREKVKEVLEPIATFYAKL